jgi:multiple sugar transport system permease protein
MTANITIATLKHKPVRRVQKFIHREGTAFYAFISLWLLGFIFLQIFPMVSALVISFTNFNGMDLSSTVFIGWSNYWEALTSSDAHYSMSLTLLYAVFSIPLILGLALGLALLLNQKISGRGMYRTTFYLPTMVPIGATALIFKAILDSNSGFLNLFIGLFRKTGTVTNWLTDYGLYCLVALAVWQCGTTMVIFLAGLQGIPEEMHEAAAIDGANNWQVFRHVTWPLLSPITYFQFMLNIIGAMQMFVPAAVMSQADATGQFWNLKHSMSVYPGYALQQMMASQRFGYGTALVWLLFVIVLIIALFVSKTSKYWVYYAIEQERGAKE